MFLALFAQLPQELLRCQFDLTQNFADERTCKVLSRVVGNSRRPAVTVAVKDVAPLLANSLKTKLEKDTFELPKPHDRKATHTATSTCWSPTKRGRSSMEPLYSSRHNSKTSFRFTWSSSKVAPCVCAPGMPGQLPRRAWFRHPTRHRQKRFSCVLPRTLFISDFCSAL